MKQKEECPMNNLIERLKTQYPVVYNNLCFIDDFGVIPTIFEEYQKAFKIKDMLIRVAFIQEIEEYYFVISYKGNNFNSRREFEWCFNFELTAQMACIENCFEILNKELTNTKTTEK